VNVHDIVSDWITLRAGALAPRTVESYRATVRLHITPLLGHRKAARLKPAHVSRLLSGLCERGISRTAELVYIILRAAFREAVRAGSIPASPVDRVPPPRHFAADARWWSEGELKLFLASLQDDQFSLAWRLALCCGLRRGELAGLRWCDVDLANRVLRIRNQRQRIGGRGVIDCPPKSKSALRDIPLPDPLISALDRHFVLQSAENSLRGAPECPYVLISPSGAGFDPRGLHRAFKSACASVSGVRSLSLHGLRHTMAAVSVSAGVSTRVLQSLLGHSSITTTAAVYAHVVTDAQRAAIDLVAASVL